MMSYFAVTETLFIFLIDLFSRHTALYTTRSNVLLDQKQPRPLKLLRSTSYLVLLKPKEIEKKKKKKKKWKHNNNATNTHLR